MFRGAFPVFRAWQAGLAHIGAHGSPGGGSVGRVVVHGIKWRLKWDRQAGGMFAVADCALCRTAGWGVEKESLP